MIAQNEHLLDDMVKDEHQLLFVAHKLWEMGIVYDDEKELMDNCKKIYNNFLNSEEEYITHYLNRYYDEE